MIKEKLKRDVPVDDIPDVELPKSHTLRNIPADVFRLIMKEQSEIKQKKGTNMFSFECTIYKMIRDYNKCREVSKDFKPDVA